MSGLAIGFPFLSNASYVEVSEFHGGDVFSIHLSGIVNGLTQSIALAGEASAVAVAPISAFAIPKYRAMLVATGLPLESVRRTATATRSDAPVVGFIGKVTSVARTETCPAMTLFICDPRIALVTAGPPAERSVKLSYTSAVAPASAPASAEFCAWLRAVINMPTSMASMLAPTNAIMPNLTNTKLIPD